MSRDIVIVIIGEKLGLVNIGKALHCIWSHAPLAMYSLCFHFRIYREEHGRIERRCLPWASQSLPFLVSATHEADSASLDLGYLSKYLTSSIPQCELRLFDC